MFEHRKEWLKLSLLQQHIQSLWHRIWLSIVIVKEQFLGVINTDSFLFIDIGCAHSDNGCKYEGAFMNGMMHGIGRFLWSDGAEYEGSFILGEVNSICFHVNDPTSVIFITSNNWPPDWWIQHTTYTCLFSLIVRSIASAEKECSAGNVFKEIASTSVLS